MKSEQLRIKILNDYGIDINNYRNLKLEKKQRRVPGYAEWRKRDR